MRHPFFEGWALQFLNGLLEGLLDFREVFTVRYLAFFGDFLREEGLLFGIGREAFPFPPKK